MELCDNYTKVKFKSKDILFYAFSLLWLQKLFLFLTKWGIVNIFICWLKISIKRIILFMIF